MERRAASLWQLMTELSILLIYEVEYIVKKYIEKNTVSK